jgi:acetyl esterase/lipase
MRALDLLKGAALSGAVLVGAAAPTAAEPAPIRSGSQLLSSLVADRGIATETGIAYGPHPRQKLDVYRADPASETSAIVAFYYGGAWTSGDRATYQFVGAALAARGITTVVPDYRLYPEVRFPAFVDDAAKAYGWTAANLSRGCGRERPIIVVGHSAGAHTAALIALDRTYLTRNAPMARRPAALVGLAGPYSFDPTVWPSTKDIFATARDMPDRTRPVSFARADAPPSLLLQGRDDTTVKAHNTRDLAAALTRAGAAVKVTDYPGIGHVGLVLTIARPLRWRAPVLDDIVAFVDKHSQPCAPRAGPKSR